jgi:hypothetical protein
MRATGPDVAPGGEAISVEIDQAETTLSGYGVLRRDFQDALLQVIFTLEDASGGRYLYEGELSGPAEGLYGGGYFIGLEAPHSAGAWTAGDPEGRRAPPGYQVGVSYSTHGEDEPGPSFPGQGLPPLADTLLTFPGPDLTPQPVDPPAIATAGQVIQIRGLTSQPLVPGPLTYSVDFGDGTVSPTDRRQTVPHVYAEPGVYTVLVFVTDASGVTSYGATQVRITAP